MRLLVNENLPRQAIERLRERGHDVVWVRESGTRLSDREILRRAQSERRALVTMDKDIAAFAFRLTRPESEALRRSRSRNVTLKRGSNIKYAPMAFTEHGAIMAASILNSGRAVRMSLFVVRAFVTLRRWVAHHEEVCARLTALEERVGAHDQDLQVLIRGIRRLMEPVSRPQRRIGFERRAGSGGPPLSSR
ncbi:MAG TPA: DUF5615 family PIN-like protein [Planctomycetota bacterium]|nr:DUF5615 family PIN-like protein [Planctomycetota bacterium]